MGTVSPVEFSGDIVHLNNFSVVHISKEASRYYSTNRWEGLCEFNHVLKEEFLLVGMNHLWENGLQHTVTDTCYLMITF